MENCEQTPSTQRSWYEQQHDAASVHSTYAQALRAASFRLHFLDNAMQVILRLE